MSQATTTTRWSSWRRHMATLAHKISLGAFAVLLLIFAAPAAALADDCNPTANLSCLINKGPDLNKAKPIITLGQVIISWLVLAGVILSAVTLLVLLIMIIAGIFRPRSVNMKQRRGHVLLVLIIAGLLTGTGMTWLFSTTGSVLGSLTTTT